MENPDEGGVSAASVNYDDTPIAQLEIDGVDYRVDTGLGSNVAISRREPGTWTWVPVAAARWDGLRLRARGLGHTVVAPLAAALASAMKDRDEAAFG